MSVYVNTNYDGFMATVTVESDEIDKIDLKHKDFRIDITDVVEQSSRAAEYQIQLEELEQNKGFYNDLMAEVLLRLKRASFFAKANLENPYRPTQQFKGNTEETIEDNAAKAISKIDALYDMIANYSYADEIPSSVQLARNLNDFSHETVDKFFLVSTYSNTEIERKFYLRVYTASGEGALVDDINQATRFKTVQEANDAVSLYSNKLKENKVIYKCYLKQNKIIVPIAESYYNAEKEEWEDKILVNDTSWQAAVSNMYATADGPLVDTDTGDTLYRVKHTWTETLHKLELRDVTDKFGRKYKDYVLVDAGTKEHIFYYNETGRQEYIEGEIFDDSAVSYYTNYSDCQNALNDYKERYGHDIVCHACGYKNPQTRTECIDCKADITGDCPDKFEVEEYNADSLKTILAPIVDELNDAAVYANKLDIKYENVPMLSIYNLQAGAEVKDNHVATDVFCNADYETLLQQGMQYWVHENEKILTFRFIPQMRAQYKFQAVHVVVALDYNNVANFDISLLPRLITGDIERKQDAPFIPHTVSPDAPPPYNDTLDPQIDLNEEHQSSRVDYIFNTYEQDNNHLYVNSTPESTDDLYNSKKVPVYCVKSSAYISREMSEGVDVINPDGSEGVSADYNFQMKKIRSYLYDTLASSAIELPWSIRPFVPEDELAGSTENPYEWIDDMEIIKDLKPAATTIELIPNYSNTAEVDGWKKYNEAGVEIGTYTFNEINKLEVLGYEVCQTISASALNADGTMFAKNQVYLSMEV